MLCVFFLPLSEMIKLLQEKKKSKLYRKGHLYEVIGDRSVSHPPSKSFHITDFVSVFTDVHWREFERV